MIYSDMPENFRLEKQLLSLLKTSPEETEKFRQVIKFLESIEVKKIVLGQIAAISKKKIQFLVTNLKYFASLKTLADSDKAIEFLGKITTNISNLTSYESN